MSSDFANLVANALLYGEAIPGSKLTLDTLQQDLKKRAMNREKILSKHPERVDPTDTSDAALALLLARIDNFKEYATSYEQFALEDPYKTGCFNAAVICLNMLNGTDFRTKLKPPFPEEGFTKFSPTAIKCNPDADTGLRYKHNSLEEVEAQLLAIDVVDVVNDTRSVLYRDLQTGGLETLPLELFEATYTCLKVEESPEKENTKSEETKKDDSTKENTK
jgi:hypothetical protein